MYNWFDHLFVLLVAIIIPLMSIMSGRFTEKETSNLPPKKHIYYSNGLVLIIGGLLILTSWNISNKPWDILGVNMPVWNEQVKICIGVLLLFFVADTVYSFIRARNFKNEAIDLSNVIPLQWDEYRHYLFMVFAAGICEEIVFRGFLINYLQHFLKPIGQAQIIAIVLPSIIFSLSHLYQGLWAVLKIFFLSVLFGLIFIFSKSLLIVVILHISIDLTTGAAGVIMYQNRKQEKS